MKKFASLALIVLSTSAVAQTYVAPYVKQDGTYVEGHYKSQPNNTKTDNYSSQGNTNPYTGKEGTVDPYKPQTAPSYQTCHYTKDGRYVCK